MTETEARSLSDRIRETSLAAHRFLRHGHNEKVYENSLRNRLRAAGFNVEQQAPINVHDEDGSLLGEFCADLLVNDTLIIELKACRALHEEHIAQVLGYLRASRHEHALLINFGASRLEIRKFIFRNED